MDWDVAGDLGIAVTSLTTGVLLHWASVRRMGSALSRRRRQIQADLDILDRLEDGEARRALVREVDESVLELVTRAKRKRDVVEGLLRGVVWLVAAGLAAVVLAADDLLLTDLWSGELADRLRAYGVMAAGGFLIWIVMPTIEYFVWQLLHRFVMSFVPKDDRGWAEFRNEIGHRVQGARARDRLWRRDEQVVT